MEPAALAKELGREALRYLYRILFLLYAEGRPEYGACSPDLPGCVALGDSPDEALKEMTEALHFHLEGLRQGGERVPEPSTVRVAMIEAA